jgi:hypothetical protein
MRSGITVEHPLAGHQDGLSLESVPSDARNVEVGVEKTAWRHVRYTSFLVSTRTRLQSMTSRLSS